MSQQENKIYIGVTALLVNKDEQILMGVRKNAFSAGELGVPSGHVDPGETFQQALKRELKEETGTDLINEEGLILIAITNYILPEWDRQYITFDFLVKEWKGEIEAMEPQKCDEWKWFDLDRIPENVHLPAKKTIEHYKEWKKTHQTILD